MEQLEFLQTVIKKQIEQTDKILSLAEIWASRINPNVNVYEEKELDDYGNFVAEDSLETEFELPETDLGYLLLSPDDLVNAGNIDLEVSDGGNAAIADATI